MADFNGDGKGDVVVTNNRNTSQEVDTVAVLLNNGDGTLAAPLATPLFAVSGPFGSTPRRALGGSRPSAPISVLTPGGKPADFTLPRAWTR